MKDSVSKTTFIIILCPVMLELGLLHMYVYVDTSDSFVPLSPSFSDYVNMLISSTEDLKKIYQCYKQLMLRPSVLRANGFGLLNQNT